MQWWFVVANVLEMLASFAALGSVRVMVSNHVHTLWTIKFPTFMLCTLNQLTHCSTLIVQFDPGSWSKLRLLDELFSKDFLKRLMDLTTLSRFPTERVTVIPKVE